MMKKMAVCWILILTGLVANAQEPPAAKPEPQLIDFTCPMDKDVKTKGPGKCPRCGMKLVANLPEPVEYGLTIRTSPAIIDAGKPVELTFDVRHPRTGEPVKDFEIVHEKIYHLFLISQDLGFFAHEHPEAGADGVYRYRTKLPRPGAYRLVSDFYPAGGTPQFLIRTLLTRGATAAQIAAIPQLVPDLGPKRGENVTVELVTEPKQPIAGKETLLFFRLDNEAGVQQYLGAWGHLLAASGDLIDLIHDHPLYTTLPQIQFNVIFPREATYRLWAQFQRNGIVNTVAFNVPVTALR
jgi:hypothetical protein